AGGGVGFDYRVVTHGEARRPAAVVDGGTVSLDGVVVLDGDWRRKALIRDGYGGSAEGPPPIDDVFVFLFRAPGEDRASGAAEGDALEPGNVVILHGDAAGAGRENGGTGRTVGVDSVSGNQR